MFVIRVKRPVPAQGLLFAGVPFPSSFPCPNDSAVMSINAYSAGGAHLRLRTDLDHVRAFVESHILQPSTAHGVQQQEFRHQSTCSLAFSIFSKEAIWGPAPPWIVQNYSGWNPEGLPRRRKLLKWPGARRFLGITKQVLKPGTSFDKLTILYGEEGPVWVLQCPNIRVHHERVMTVAVLLPLSSTPLSRSDTPSSTEYGGWFDVIRTNMRLEIYLRTGR
ncbi:hypothetical protein J3458_022499 [Metarhizium acridum]|uniref:uncharacterized protein n=1 Tax=Metarhizium acridum TaxID=92637 RepID=UPI001C6B81BB|nr:hypothetical protein J3458_022499 [Metarhizium acridum]